MIEQRISRFQNQSLSWYIYLLGGVITIYALLAGGVDTGWTFYTPYSTTYSNSYVVATGLGIFINGFSSILTGLNFIVTIHTMRAPGMKWFRMPLFLWSHYATSLIMVLAPQWSRSRSCCWLSNDSRKWASLIQRWAATRFVSALVLVLFASGRLHHDPARNGRCQ